MAKKLLNNTVLIWLVILFILPLPTLYTLKAGLPTGANSFGIQIGALAYLWMLVAIYISIKPKWLDHLIGLPKAYMIHGMLSLIALILAFFHKELDNSQGLIKWTGDTAFIIFLGLAAYSLIFLAGWLTTRIPVLQVIKEGLEKFFKHELTLWLHRLNLIATLLVFIHIQLIAYIVLIKPFMILIWLSTVFVFFSYLWFHFKPKAHGIKAQLVANDEVLSNVRQLTVKLPRRPHLRLKAGDYAFISFPEIAGMSEPHPFSVLNNPVNSDTLEFAIRGDGDFTKNLVNVPVDSLIRVDGGFGLYQSLIDKYKADQLFIIGGGIGVVPLFSIIEGNPNLATQFFYTVKTDGKLLYQDRLADWQKRPNFKVNYQVGRYSDDYIVSQLPDTSSNFVILIGGPIAMGRHWQKVLAANDIDPERVYFEEFSW
ncbi:FAD-binding oxidoreductase [Streptococcus hongkongensis]